MKNRKLRRELFLKFKQIIQDIYRMNKCNVCQKSKHIEDKSVATRTRLIKCTWSIFRAKVN